MSDLRLLSTINQTRAAGVNRPNYSSFNDIIAIGEFPVDQKIVRIAKIQIWTSDSRVIGIRPTYVVRESGELYPVTHGRDTGTSHEVVLEDEHFLVGVWGQTDARGDISSITFFVLESEGGRIAQYGPWGPPGTLVFGTFGKIIAFAGTNENAHGLCALSFIKEEIPVSSPFLPAIS